MRHPSFDRVRRFGRRAVGVPIGVYASGLLTAIFSIFLVLIVPILAELLSTRGTLTVPIAEQAGLSTLGTAPDVISAHTVSYEHRGLLPSVWRLRDSWLGPLYASVYTSIPAVRGNHSCLLAVFTVVCLLVVLVGASLAWFEFAVSKAALRTVDALRGEIHDQSHRLGASDLFLGQHATARELFVSVADTVRQGLVAWWRVVPHALLFFGVMIALALSVNTWLTLVTVLLVTAIGWILSEIRERIRYRRRRLTDAAERFLSPVVDHFDQNTEISQLPVDDQTQRRQFEENLLRYEQVALSGEVASAMLKPLTTLFVLLGANFVILLAGYNVLGQPTRVPLADAVLLGVALCSTVYPLVRIEQLVETLPRTEHASAKIFVYLDREPRVGQLPHAAPLQTTWRKISFRDVTLADMQGRLLLNAVSFDIPAKSRAVVFCSDEASSRAIAALLARFCDPAAGQVLFDRQDVSHAALHSARQQVALILADHLLFGGNLRENLVGAETAAPVNDDRIRDALKRVNAYEIVQTLPEGLETPIGPQGVSLATGEIIRIGLARAMLRSPTLIVIEEPRESLDQTTAEKVGLALDEVCADCTLVILARRLATLRGAERVLFFHEGRLLADGTHSELLHSNDLYRHLNYVRFNEFRDRLT